MLYCEKLDRHICFYIAQNIVVVLLDYVPAF